MPESSPCMRGKANLLLVLVVVVLFILYNFSSGGVEASRIIDDLASNPYSREQLNDDDGSLRERIEKVFGKNRRSVMEDLQIFSPMADKKDVKADIEYKFLGLDFGSQYVNGHLILLKNPIGHFSILEPGPPQKASSSTGKPINQSPISQIINAYEKNRDMRGGCYYNVTATVRDTAKNNLNNHFCHYSTNAGFFNTHIHSCLGNVISDGRIAHSSHRHNVNFGITKDNKFFIGYLDDKIDLNIFDQLIAGVIWLVKSGSNFVKQSAIIEEMGTQETGDRFTTVRASRSAIGYDGEGRLVSISIDGDGNHAKGPTLMELADLLISLGVVNAINLDGGGSVTVVRDNNIIINSVSDGCSESANDYDADFAGRNSYFRCPRKVMTTTCFHDNLSETERAIQKTLIGQDQEQFSARVNQFILLIQVLIAIVLVIGFSVIILLIVFSITLCCCGKNVKGPNYAKLGNNDLEMMNLALDEEERSEGDVLQTVDKEFMNEASPKSTTL